jgi:hypothetical protein
MTSNPDSGIVTVPANQPVDQTVEKLEAALRAARRVIDESEVWIAAGGMPSERRPGTWRKVGTDGPLR